MARPRVQEQNHLTFFKRYIHRNRLVKQQRISQYHIWQIGIFRYRVLISVRAASMDWMRCIIERFPLFCVPRKKSSHGKFDSLHNKNASGIFHCSIPDHFFILLSNFTDVTLGFGVGFWMNLQLRFPPQCLEYGFTHHLMLVCIENGNETLPCRIVILCSSLPKDWQCLNEFVPSKLLRRDIAEERGCCNFT